jgi:excinuclease ABC subunit C
MKRDLRMDVLPKHIECFDNSNLLGNQPVSSCVVFKNGKPSKKDYRHFHVKTVEGPNDFASMEEIVMRRYSRLLNEKVDLPDLVIIDGGKGQLSAAMKSIQKLDLENKMTVVGIAKRLEEIFYPNDSIPLLISKKSPSLRIIQQARDEAHRFALQFHRDTRSKKFTESILDHIKGIGEKTKMKLLQEFKSIQNIKEASYQVLEEKTGKKTALLIRNYFDSND